jgi:hypothetical protein
MCERELLDRQAGQRMQVIQAIPVMDVNTQKLLARIGVSKFKLMGRT